MRFLSTSQLTVCFLFMVLMIGCGGSDGSSKNTSDDLVEITKEEYRNEISEGVWRTIGDRSGDFTYINDDSTMYLSIETSEFAVAGAIEMVGDQRYVDGCELDGPLLWEEAVGETPSDCEGAAYTYQKTKDGSTYHNHQSCDGGGTSTFELSRLTDNPVFDLGTAAVSFESANHPDVSVDSGICGSIWRVDEQYEIVSLDTEPNTYNIDEYEINVRVPYQDNYLLLNFVFAEQPGVAEFSLLPPHEVESNDQASLSIETASSEFGATIDDNGDYYAESGTLTLTSYGATFAEGSFNATIEMDDAVLENISGTFSITIE